MASGAAPDLPGGVDPSPFGPVPGASSMSLALFLSRRLQPVAAALLLLTAAQIAHVATARGGTSPFQSAWERS